MPRSGGPTSGVLGLQAIVLLSLCGVSLEDQLRNLEMMGLVSLVLRRRALFKEKR